MKKTCINSLILSSILFSFSHSSIAGDSVALTHDQNIYWQGNLKYTAKKGDTLEIIKVKPCRSEPSKECWVVSHADHGKGAVRKEWVEAAENTYLK